MESIDWMERIRGILSRAALNGVMVSDGADQRLLAFCEEVRKAALSMNLVSRADLPRLPDKHVAPSVGVLLVCGHLSGQDWIDVGTGGGFPGMVVRLCRPEVAMTLLDSSEKKIEFLKRVRRALGLENLSIVRARVEHLSPPDLQAGGAERTPRSGSATPRPGEDPVPARFDVILMRAVASLERSIELVDAISGPGTRLVTFKGPAWERELQAARRAMMARSWSFENVHSIPWTQARIISLLRS